MNIGQAAEATGVTAKMIRYYEGTGLIRAAERSASGYRHYDDHDVHTLRFVRRARDLGFSVGQIGQLLALWRDGSRSSAQVKALSLAHVAALEKKIADLQGMVGALSDLASRCDGDHRPDCPIIDDLASGVRDSSPHAQRQGFASDTVRVADHRTRPGTGRTPPNS